MNSINKPNYSHYTRIKTLTAEEANWLLASIELRDKCIEEPAEYERLLATETKLATKVLYDAITHKTLKCYLDLDACAYDEFDRIEGYDFNKVIINIENFCMWALENNYKLPDTLAKMAQEHGGNAQSQRAESITEQSANADSNSGGNEATSNKETAQPNGTPNKGGKPKGYLAEAVEHVYYEILKQEKPGLLKPSKIREFIIYMKEMATKGNRHADEYVMLRIKSIQAPEEGTCTIITEDNVKLSGQNETIERGKPYTNNDVSKILTRLRKNNTKA